MSSIQVVLCLLYCINWMLSGMMVCCHDVWYSSCPLFVVQYCFKCMLYVIAWCLVFQLLSHVCCIALCVCCNCMLLHDAWYSRCCVTMYTHQYCASYVWCCMMPGILAVLCTQYIQHRTTLKNRLFVCPHQTNWWKISRLRIFLITCNKIWF